MAEITAAAARALADANSGNIDTELETIYTAITARATAGFYNYEHVFVDITTKAAVIAKLTSTPLFYTTTVYDDGTTMLIDYSAA